MSIVTIHPLADGPLSLEAVRNARAARIAAMASDLLVNGSYADQDDAIVTLLSCGYASFEVFALAPDAIYEAKQHAVVMEMAGS